MGIGVNVAGAPAYQGPQVTYTSVNEARNDAGAEAGGYQPGGTVGIAVEPGDTVSVTMTKMEPPLDWNDPQVRNTFFADNPQFDPETGQRNVDHIWPGEVVYIRDPVLSAAEELLQAHGLSASTDSQATHQADQVALAEQKLTNAVKHALHADLDVDVDAIKAHLAQFGFDEQSVNAVVDAAAQDYRSGAYGMV